MSIFLKGKSYLYVVDIPKDRENDAYLYARELLNIPDHEITMWREFVKYDGVAAFPIN